MVLVILSFLLSLPILFVLSFIIYSRIYFHNKRKEAVAHFSTNIHSHDKQPPSSQQPQLPLQPARVMAFFHPHCAAGGGGERVLWKAIQSLENLQNKGMPVQLKVAIYTIDPYRENYKQEILKHVKNRFSIEFSSSIPITFIHLHDCVPSKGSSPTKFSMIVESWSTIQLAWKALQILTPDIFMDTTGCAFTFLVAKILANCKVGAYVHYPTISTDMLSLVWDRRPTYNNDAQITSNSLITYVKLVYYSLFALCYGFVGSLTNLVMVNSTWTYGHIRSLWRFANDIHIVYPPCDTASLEVLPLQQRGNNILSIGQFRPEKDHELQIRSFAKLIERLQNENKSLVGIQLVLIGSCRGASDEERVQKLQSLAEQLEISKYVKFVINQPFPVLKEWLGKSSIGIHTMWNEHFGIGVVEMMAAGTITIAHSTGGPKSDIIVPLEGQRTGYLATTAQEYSDAMYAIFFENSSEENTRIRTYGRKASKSFSDDVFDKSFQSALVASHILI